MIIYVLTNQFAKGHKFETIRAFLRLLILSWQSYQIFGLLYTMGIVFVKGGYYYIKTEQ